MSFTEKIAATLEKRKFGQLTNDQTIDQVFQDWVAEHHAQGKKYTTMDEDDLKETIQAHVKKINEYEDKDEWQETFVENVENAHTDFEVTK
ncbi:hypothetical protein [Bacillus sp. UNC438CL73TsuS30]|uniref:hypothetical protein n=1 Tax=Bacillus sp. UNC438CL73TsuS30 TaxID=1340434 RepID=UPI000478A2D1|nr:hypothetical protein [Bacillus sp. UNC438CL73TsuS30]